MLYIRKDFLIILCYYFQIEESTVQQNNYCTKYILQNAAYLYMINHSKPFGIAQVGMEY